MLLCIKKAFVVFIIAAALVVMLTCVISGWIAPVLAWTSNAPVAQPTATQIATSMVTPTITTFSPSSGPVGTVVTITGTNFISVNKVAFNGMIAKFTLDSDTQLQAEVPDGASDGLISVTNVAGTGTSIDDFNLTIRLPSWLWVLALIGLAASTAFVALAYWYTSKFLRKKALERSREVTQTIVPNSYPAIDSEDVARRIWLDVLWAGNYLSPLMGDGSMLVLGTPEMGRSLILKWLVQAVNRNFAQSHEMAIYLDLAQIVRTNQRLGYSSLEDVYRAILRSLVNPLLNGLEQALRERTFSSTKLPHLRKRLAEQLSGSILQISHVSIRNTLIRIWQITGIVKVKVILDNASVVQSENLPVLLDSLMRTFGRSSRVNLMVGGIQDELSLVKYTTEGRIGLQLGHDIFVGLDLEQLLMPETDKLTVVDSNGDPRTEYVSNVLSHVSSTQPRTVGRSAKLPLKYFFEPSDAWKVIFHHYKGNLKRIASALVLVVELVNQERSCLTKAALLSRLEEPGSANAKEMEL